MAGGNKRPGPASGAGRKGAYANAEKHGADGAGMAWARRYADALAAALAGPGGQKFGDPRFFRGGAGSSETSASREKR